MNTTAKAHEPTMEEILASIRRIISDDDPAPDAKGATPLKPAETPSADEPESGALGQDDIDAMLASFDAPEPPSKIVASAPAPAIERAEPAAPSPAPAPRIALDHDIDVFELTDAMSTDVAEPAPPPAQPAFASRPAPDRLISPATDEAVGAAFGSLAHTIMSNNGRTIDDLVKELLRPMLRSWLDDNLPPLVERLVRQEIERVARGGR